jgi:hypothetical protein
MRTHIPNKVYWDEEPTYNPDALLDELKRRRNITKDVHLAELLGVYNSSLWNVRHRKTPVGHSLIVRILYEFRDLDIDQVFSMMGVTEPFKDRNA